MSRRFLIVVGTGRYGRGEVKVKAFPAAVEQEYVKVQCNTMQSSYTSRRPSPRWQIRIETIGLREPAARISALYGGNSR